MALIDFTLSNARRFYSSMGNPLGLKGLMNKMHERQGIFINFKSTLLIACVFENCAVHRPLKWL